MIQQHGTIKTQKIFFRKTQSQDHGMMKKPTKNYELLQNVVVVVLQLQNL